MVDPDSLVRSPDTVGDLRSLYRDAEARAARMRLLIEAGRDLAAADAESLDEALASAARKAALFAGHAEGIVRLEGEAEGLTLIAPGPSERKVGVLTLVPRDARPPARDGEDEEALAMLGQLMAAAIDRVQRDEERDMLTALLRERERRLEAVIARLFSAQEDERRRVSRDLHDGVAQTAGALFRQLEAAKTGTSPETTARLAGMAQTLVRELRAAIANLRPTILDDLGLVAAVGSLADGLSGDGFEVEWVATGSSRWPALVETAFYRVAQEAVSNVRKHADGPCRVRIALEGEVETGRWRLVVRDWGRGLSKDAPGLVGDQVGLAIMRERMAALGGRLDLSEPPEGGVEVAAILATAP